MKYNLSAASGKGYDDLLSKIKTYCEKFPDSYSLTASVDNDGNSYCLVSCHYNNEFVDSVVFRARDDDVHISMRLVPIVEKHARAHMSVLHLDHAHLDDVILHNVPSYIGDVDDKYELKAREIRVGVYRCLLFNYKLEKARSLFSVEEIVSGKLREWIEKNTKPKQVEKTQPSTQTLGHTTKPKLGLIGLDCKFSDSSDIELINSNIPTYLGDSNNYYRLTVHKVLPDTFVVVLDKQGCQIASCGFTAAEVLGGELKAWIVLRARSAEEASKSNVEIKPTASSSQPTEIPVETQKIVYDGKPITFTKNGDKFSCKYKNVELNGDLGEIVSMIKGVSCCGSDVEWKKFLRIEFPPTVSWTLSGCDISELIDCNGKPMYSMECDGSRYHARTVTALLTYARNGGDVFKTVTDLYGDKCKIEAVSTGLYRYKFTHGSTEFYILGSHETVDDVTEKVFVKVVDYMESL